MTCDNCGQDKAVRYSIEVLGIGDDYRGLNLCSPSCLVEYAWKEKESQRKLSKSQVSA